MSKNNDFRKSSLVWKLDAMNKMLAKMPNGKDRDAAAFRYAKFIVESGDVSRLKLLLVHNTEMFQNDQDESVKCGGRELLFEAMSSAGSIEMIKTLTEHGIKLDSSADSYKYLFDYAMRGMQKIKVSIVHSDEQKKSVAELIDDLNILLVNCGHLTFSQILENPLLVIELGTLAYCGQLTDTNLLVLLRFFLDLGLDANVQLTNYIRHEQAGKIEYRSLLSVFLDWGKWEAASLLLEYGAYQSGKIVSTYRGNFNPGPFFDDFSAYLDSFKSCAATSFYLLEDGLKKKLQRRQEICRHHLEPVLDPACNLHSSFDTRPLLIIISEYVL